MENILYTMWLLYNFAVEPRENQKRKLLGENVSQNYSKSITRKPHHHHGYYEMLFHVNFVARNLNFCDFLISLLKFTVSFCGKIPFHHELYPSFNFWCFTIIPNWTSRHWTIWERACLSFIEWLDVYFLNFYLRKIVFELKIW